MTIDASVYIFRKRKRNASLLYPRAYDGALNIKRGTGVYCNSDLSPHTVSDPLLTQHPDTVYNGFDFRSAD